MQYVVAGTTIHGCSAKDTIKINVKEKFIMKHSQGKSLCKGESHEVRASGADSYVWFPANGLKNATDSIQEAHPDATTTYRVIGSDNVGCFKDTGFITIVVYPIPTVEAGMNRTINVGQSIDLIPAISSDVTEVQWFPNDGLTRNMFPGITVRPNANIDYTVEVKNIGGCTARDKISVFVLCNGGNVFIPNTFSPDGNGVNDVFYPRGTGLYRIKNMKIYNRWGEVMYERSSFLANDATASWDGTFKGKKLSPDVFVYTIDIICDNNAVLKYQGNVALVR
jgi:gliding motility-associated-like protein